MKTHVKLGMGIALVLSSLNAEVFNINPGWQLVGSSYKLNDFSAIKDSCIKYIWQYENDSWKLMTNIPIQHNYQTFTSIDSQKGFWLYSDGSCVVDIKKNFTAVIGTLSKPATIYAHGDDGSIYQTTTQGDKNSTTQTFQLELPPQIPFSIDIVSQDSSANSVSIPLSYSVDANTTKSTFYLNDNDNVNLGYLDIDNEVNNDLDKDGKSDTPHHLENSSNPIYQLDADKDGIRDYHDDDHGKYHYKSDMDSKNESTENSESNNNGENENNSNNLNTTVILPTSYSANIGQLLGSQCAGCHGTNGISNNSLDGIKGEDNLYSEMSEHIGIMSAQAKGYTFSEVSDIELWLNSL